MRLRAQSLYTGLVAAHQFDHFIVNAQEQQSWRPVSDEQGFVISLLGFEQQRSEDGSTGCPKEYIRWQEPGGLALDCGGDFPFRVCVTSFSS